jgi:lipopolysaccharide biosynthesis regulator YciM
VLDAEKTGNRFVEATLLKGDCYFALGKDNKSQYEAAANAYGTLLTSTQGTFAQRNEAGYKRARCFEMQGRNDDALALYLDVLAGRLMVDSGKAGATRPPEYLWTIQSGVKAAQLRETKQDWRGAIEVYRRLETLGGPTQALKEFRDSINKIRRDNFIYDES